MFIFVTPLSDHTFKNDTKASLGSFASPEQISMMQQVGAQAPAADLNGDGLVDLQDLITLTAESNFNKGKTVIPYTP